MVKNYGEVQELLAKLLVRYKKNSITVDIGLVEKPFQHTCLYHLQDCVVNGDYLAI